MWWLLFLIILLFFAERIYNKNYYRGLAVGDGPPSVPFLGHILLFSSLPSSKDQFNLLVKLSKTYKRLFVLHFIRKIGIVIYTYKDAEVLLSSNEHIEKGESYDFTIPWIGRGLLTSSGDKWRAHRKMITPAFHFKILTEFLEVFNRNGKTLCELLQKEVNKGPVNIYNYVNLMALDNIYESAMGVSANAQTNVNQTYVQAVKTMCSIITQRTFSFPLRTDWIFRNSKFWPSYEHALKVVHNTTEAVIEERKETMQKNPVISETEDEFNVKAKHAFLDKLLSLFNEKKLTKENVREEVDTFMFEGHDTISSGLGFTIYALATNPDVQEKAYQEQMEIFGDSDRVPTMSDLQSMEYLDRVIKESQRLYPSVPIIERHLKSDMKLSDGKILPKNSGVTVFLYAMHRDPEVWNDPDNFNPDNFLPDAVQSRNPYSHVPFSAGPRNCIGQRFALMEMKTTISKILRQFQLLPSSKPEHKIDLIAELVLISRTGIHVELRTR